MIIFNRLTDGDKAPQALARSFRTAERRPDAGQSIRKATRTIIRTAYAEKVREAFKVFAENISMGQNQKASPNASCARWNWCARRGHGAGAIGGAELVEPTAQDGGTCGSRRGGGCRGNATIDLLSAEDQALIEQALSGTTGAKPLPQRR